MGEQLITKYRPTAFAEFIGNADIVKALEQDIQSDARSRCLLFSGVTGLGKTTLARIVGYVINATVIEVDAASFSTVEFTRQFVANTQFKPLSSKKNILYIFNECQNFSKQGWEPLLDNTEHPPEWLNFAFTTTNPLKIPDAIKSRSLQLHLKPCKPNEIDELLTVIAELEGWQVDSNTMSMIVQAATGQPRKGISFLQAAHAAVGQEQVANLITSVEASDSPVSELLSFLYNGGKDWPRIKKMLEKIRGEANVMPAAQGYMNAVIIRSENDTKAMKAAHMLQILITPRDGYDENVKFTSAICDILFSQ